MRGNLVCSFNPEKSLFGCIIVSFANLHAHLHIMPGNRELGLFNMAKSTGRRKYLAMNIWVERKSHTGEGEEPFEWGDNGGTRTNGCRLALNPFLFFFGLSHSPGRNWFSHYSKDLKKKKKSQYIRFSSQVAGLILKLCQSDCSPREGCCLFQERPSITWPTLPMLKQSSHTFL